MDRGSAPQEGRMRMEQNSPLVQFQSRRASLPSRACMLSGLTEQDTVLLLPSASLVNQQQQMRDRMSRMGGSLPGMSRTPAGGPGGGPGGPPPGGGRPGGDNH